MVKAEQLSGEPWLSGSSSLGDATVSGALPSQGCVAVSA